MSKLPKDVAIRVKDVHKDFHLPHHRDDSIKHRIITAFEKKDTSIDTHHVLQGVSFDIKKGEFFGILGRNGSGKSTLLKIISEIYQPTKGMVAHQGKLVAFIELGVGFNPQLTGRDNVYLNAALLGFSRKEIDAMYDDIVSFAELEEFMDQKLNNYSSGMKVRLAFSVAIRANADILILDEVLAVGDAAFQRKCYDYFKSLKLQHKTVVLVSHNMGAIREYCDRAVLVEDGVIVHEGTADEIADEYTKLFNRPKKNTDDDQVTNKSESNVELRSLSIIQDKNEVKVIQFKKDFSVKVRVFAGSVHENVAMGMYFYDRADRSVVVISSKAFGSINLKKGWNTITYKIQNVFSDGTYHINFAIEERETKKLLVQRHKISPFSVIGQSESGYSRHSLVHPNIEVRVE